MESSENELTAMRHRIAELEKTQEQMRAELSASEARYRRLADNVIDVIWTMDMNLNFTDVTPSITALLGLTVEEAMHRRLPDAVSPASLALAIQVFSEELENGAPHSHDRFWSRTVEMDNIHKDGHLVPVEVKFSVQYDEHNRPIGIMGVTRDITERKKMETALRESEDLWRTYLNEANDVILGLDATGHIVLVNRSLCQATGYTESELLGHSPARLLAPETRDLVMSTLARILHGEDVDRLELELLTRMGQRILLEVRGRKYFRNGKFIGTLHIGRDITARKQAEEAIRESEVQLRALIDYCPVSIIKFDPDGNILLWNAMAEKIYGWTADEVLGKPLPVVPVEKLDEKLGFQKRVNQGEVIPYIEVERKRKDGSWIDVGLSVAPLFDKTGTVYAQLSITIDVTERKRMENELRAAYQQMETQFTELQQLHLQLTEQSTRDPLTQLFNRRFLNETLPREIARAIRHQTGLGVLMIDLDHFKRINDAFGHLVGDETLRSVARTIQANVRACDIVCRYGGEEFLCVLLDTTEEIAHRRAEQVRLAISNLTVSIQGVTIQITASIGVAILPPDGTDMVTVLNTADAAMYRAKQSGRNCVRRLHGSE